MTGYPSPDEPWADAVRDSVALVEAVRAEDRLGTSAILRNGDRDLMCITLAKLLSEAADDLAVPPAWFRRWSASAVTRP